MTLSSKQSYVRYRFRLLHHYALFSTLNVVGDVIGDLMT